MGRFRRDICRLGTRFRRDIYRLGKRFRRDICRLGTRFRRDASRPNFRPVEADSLQKKIALAESERSAHEATLYTYRPGEARSRQSQAMRDELKNKIQALADSERSAYPDTRQAM